MKTVLWSTFEAPHNGKTISLIKSTSSSPVTRNKTAKIGNMMVGTLESLDFSLCWMVFLEQWGFGRSLFLVFACVLTCPKRGMSSDRNCSFRQAINTPLHQKFCSSVSLERFGAVFLSKTQIVFFTFVLGVLGGSSTEADRFISI